MPITGTEQNRLKTALDIAEERLSIERDISKVLRDRTETLEDSAGVEKKLLDTIQRRAEFADRSGKRRMIMESDLRELMLKAEAEKNDILKQGFETRIIQLKKEIEKEEQKFRISQLIYARTKDQIVIQKALYEQEKKRFEKSMSYLGHLGDIFKMQQKHYMHLQNSTKLQGRQLMLAASLMATLEMMFETFKNIDDALAKFRITMGMMRKDAERISGDIRNVATEFAHVGVSVESAANAVMALGNEFGGTMKVSKDLVETTALLKSQLGVAEENSAGFFRNMGALTKTTAQSQRYMAYVVDQMTAAAGIPLNLVMQDVAKMSGNALALVSKMPLAIIKTAVEARKLGTTVNKMADASANLLNFTESVQAEMEASVLVGQAINLQRARYLAYQGRIVESTQEILAIAKKIDFEHLDYFQMQAFAAATGRSTDELLKMIQAERQLRQARSDKSLGLQNEVRLYDEIMSRQETALKNESLQRELTVKQMANQARMTALQQQWNQLWMETMRVMYPVFNIVLGLATVLVRIGPQLTTIGSLLNGTLGISEKLVKVWTNGWPYIWKASAGIGGFGTKAMAVLAKVVNFRPVFGFFSRFPIILNAIKFAAPFAKAIPVIGWIITAFQFIYNMFKRYQEFTKAGDNPIVAGLKAIGYALYDTLLAPFKGAWNWIKKIFVGESPSQLGLGILKGIIGVQAKIFDALTSPFRRFLAWIVDKIPGMGGLTEKIRGGMSGALENVGVLEKQKQLAVRGPATEVTPITTTTPVKTELTPEQQKQKETDSFTLAEILKSLKDLNANLMSGKIGVYIDGQLMSSTISRQTQFKRGYGVNMV